MCAQHKLIGVLDKPGNNLACPTTEHHFETDQSCPLIHRYSGRDYVYQLPV